MNIIKDFLLKKILNEDIRTDASGKPTILDASFRTGSLTEESIEHLLSLAQKLQPPIEKLIIKGSKLKTIPEGVELLHQLKSLDVSGNKITKIPKYLEKLEILNLANNPIPDALTQLKDFKNLTDLDISNIGLTDAQFTASLLGQFPELQKLYAHHNQLTTLPNLKNTLPKKFRVFNFSKNPLSKSAKKQLQTFETGRPDEILDFDSGKVYSHTTYTAAIKWQKRKEENIRKQQAKEERIQQEQQTQKAREGERKAQPKEASVHQKALEKLFGAEDSPSILETIENLKLGSFSNHQKGTLSASQVLLDFLAEFSTRFPSFDQKKTEEAYRVAAQELINNIISPQSKASKKQKKVHLQNLATALNDGSIPWQNLLTQVAIGKQLIGGVNNLSLLPTLLAQMEETKHALSQEEKIIQTQWLINSLSPEEDPMTIVGKKDHTTYLNKAYHAIQPAISMVSYLGSLAGIQVPDPTQTTPKEQRIAQYEKTMLADIIEAGIERYCQENEVRMALELPRQKRELSTLLTDVSDDDVHQVFQKFLRISSGNISRLKKKYSI